MKLLAILLLTAFTGLRLWAAGMLPVTPIEAYYWMGANHLDWAFFDGPGGTAFLVHLGSMLFGDGAMGLRLAFPLLAAVATIAAFLFTRSLFGEITGFWAAVALNTMPIFNLAAIHAGPQMPALAFALLAAWAIVRALDHGRVAWWLIAGACMAMAEQFFYPTAALFAGVAAVSAISPRHRAHWRAPGIYLALLVTGAALAPAVAWNQSHGWPAGALGTWRTELAPQWSEICPTLWAGILLVSFPIFGAAIFGATMLGRSSRIHPKPRLILCLAVPFALLWLGSVAHGDVSATILLLAAAIATCGAASIFLPAHFRAVGIAVLVLAAASSIFPLSQAADPWTRSNRGIAWKGLAGEVAKLLAVAQTNHATSLFLIASDPDATAALKYHLARSSAAAGTEVFLRESQDLSNQFGFWPRYDDFVQSDKPADELFRQEGNTVNPYMGRSALYLSDEEFADLPQTITGAFSQVSPFATLTLEGGRKMRVYLCEDYQTMPL